MAMIGNSGFMSQKLGPITYGQLTGIVLGIGAALLLTVAMGSNILGWLFAAIMLFFIPHLFGAGPKTKAVYGTVFFAAALAIGGAAVNPSAVDRLDDVSAGSGGSFQGYSISYDGNILTAHMDGWEPKHADASPRPYLVAAKVGMVVSGGIYLDGGLKNAEAFDTWDSADTLTATGLDMDDLYYIALVEYYRNADGEYVADYGTLSRELYTGQWYTGDPSGICWFGAFYGLAYTLAIFYFIVAATWFLRSRLSRTRKKMEDEGRLYPQGYGRCSFCGTVVLPGEIKCRKCGAYIDRPESMRKHGNDYCKCSSCGATVPMDAESCPKCGAMFDEVENEVLHADGTVDISEGSVKCPSCGADVPPNAEHCPVCMKKLRV